METILAILKSITSNLKLLWVVFGQILEKFGLLFISKSGHTALHANSDQTQSTADSLVPRSAFPQR